MSVLVVADQIFPLSSDGRLLDLSEWTMEVAEALASGDSLPLTDQHWEIIDFLRCYHRKFGGVPSPESMRLGLANRFGPEKSTDEHLSRLFPGGVLVQGTKIAGVPAPGQVKEMDTSGPAPKLVEEGIEYCPWQFEYKTKFAG